MNQFFQKFVSLAVASCLLAAGLLSVCHVHRHTSDPTQSGDTALSCNCVHHDRVVYETPGDDSLDQALRDSRWDMTYLAMQVVIEGLALAAFGNIRDMCKNPLTQQLNAYVMQDESRHVAFGRLTLKEYYPNLTQAERDEREEFLVEACYLMRDRFEARELYKHLDLPVDQIVEAQNKSDFQKHFRTMLFTRIVPIVRDIGLWSDKIRRAYADMGVLGFADVNYDELSESDNKRAEEFDDINRQTREDYVKEVAALGAAE